MDEQSKRVKFVHVGELPPGNFNLPDACPDCARLRALLREAKKLLEDAAYTSTSDEYTALELSCFELAARIAAEVEDGK